MLATGLFNNVAFLVCVDNNTALVCVDNNVALVCVANNVALVCVGNNVALVCGGNNIALHDRHIYSVHQQFAPPSLPSLKVGAVSSSVDGEAKCVSSRQRLHSSSSSDTGSFLMDVVSECIV